MNVAGSFVDTTVFAGWVVMTTCGMTTRLICPGVLSLIEYEPLINPATRLGVGLKEPDFVPEYWTSV